MSSLQHDPHFTVIVLTITDSDQVIREALDAGAHGFILKSDAARDLVPAVEALQNKRMFFTPRVNDLALAGFPEKGQTVSRTEAPKLPTLTALEREITRLLVEGNSSAEVASLLNLSTKTVETHRSNIMRKLSFDSVRDLDYVTVRAGFLEKGQWVNVSSRLELQSLEPKLSVVIVATDNEQRALLKVLVDGTIVVRSVHACANCPVAGDDPVTRSVRAANPDVILVDIPVNKIQSALRAIELLHQEVPESAIFAIGSLSQERVIVNAMRVGAREFIERPTTTTALLEAFARLTTPTTRRELLS